MTNSGSMNANSEMKLVVLCDKCYQKLRIPKRAQKQRIRCPACKHEFDYTYNRFGLSPSSKKHVLIGLAGGVLGSVIVEILQLTLLSTMQSPLIASLFATAGFGVGLGAVMGASEGFFRKNKPRMLYGLKIGAILGLIGGAVAGIIAQIAYGILLSSVAADADPSVGLQIFARTIAWGILGLLIGGSYGIKENTSGDLKFGIIGGLLGGLVGGLLFDPLTSAITFGDGTIGRLVGFAVLGITVSVAINHFQEVAILGNRSEMYQSLTRRLPANPRLQSGTGGSQPRQNF